MPPAVAARDSRPNSDVRLWIGLSRYTCREWGGAMAFLGEVRTNAVPLPRWGRDRGLRGSRRDCPGDERPVAARWPAVCGSPLSGMCFCVTKTSGRGAPPDPRKTSARHRGPPDMVCPRKRVRSRDGVAAARDLRVPSLRGDAEKPGGQLSANGGSPTPGSGARHPSGTPPPGTVRRVLFAPPRRRRSPGVRGGTAPRQPPQGTHGVWPRGVCWLSGLSRVQQAHRRTCPRAVVDRRQCGGGAPPRALRRNPFVIVNSHRVRWPSPTIARQFAARCW